MFFDVGFSELFLLAVLGLLILGPERLPAVARTLGGWVRRGRQMASEFQRELEREVDLSEIKQLKHEFDKAGQPFRDAGDTLKEGNSILDKTIKESTDLRNPVQIGAVDVKEIDAPVGSDSVEHHEPMASTESSDHVKPADPVATASTRQTSSQTASTLKSTPPSPGSSD